MLHAYPVILSHVPDGGPYPYLVMIPDFNSNTQGKDVPDAIYMARDAIGLMGITMEDMREEIPAPSQLSAIEAEPGDIITLVDVDFAEYRRRNDLRTVRRNCTLPAWLDDAASQARINVSAVLQNALKQELHLA